MSISHKYSTVKWEEYLVSETSERAHKFISANGDVLFKTIFEKIKDAIENESKQILMLVHPNATALVVVNESDYLPILNHCIVFYEQTENYRMCSKILKFTKTLKSNK